MEAWIDISRPLSPATPVWPGDRPLQLHRRVDASGVLSWMETTCHVGTHLDAPLHLDPTLERGVEGIALDVLCGSAQVVRVDGGGGPIRPAHLRPGWRPSCTRVLLRTDSHPLGDPVEAGFSGLTAGLVHWLAACGVLLVGVDTPSVDAFESEDLEAHHALVQRGMAWLEGLWLGGVENGIYELVAAPMALVGAEAAPVRALLRPLEEA